MTITGKFEQFKYFDFETNFLKNEIHFEKTGIFLLIESIKAQHLKVQKHTRQKLMIKQVECGVEIWTPITKNVVFFLLKICFSYRTFCKELI